jgi:predicted Zn-dependent protease
LLASGNPKSAQRALEKARSRDFKNVRLHQDLAVAYAKLGNNGMASLVTAERYALQGKLKDAKLHATRAQGLLQRGTPAWQRAQDVLSAARTK